MTTPPVVIRTEEQVGFKLNQPLKIFACIRYSVILSDVLHTQLKFKSPSIIRTFVLKIKRKIRILGRNTRNVVVPRKDTIIAKLLLFSRGNECCSYFFFILDFRMNWRIICMK